MLSAVRLSEGAEDARDLSGDEVITVVIREVQADSGFTDASLTVRGEQFTNDVVASRQFAAMLSLFMKEMQSKAAAVLPPEASNSKSKELDAEDMVAALDRVYDLGWQPTTAEPAAAEPNWGP